MALMRNLVGLCVFGARLQNATPQRLRDLWRIAAIILKHPLNDHFVTLTRRRRTVFLPDDGKEPVRVSSKRGYLRTSLLAATPGGYLHDPPSARPAL
jgi:hypothetical protein